MKFRSKKTKPAVGMEMMVTLSMPAGATLEESERAILAFFSGVSDLCKETGAAWIRINCRSIPAEFEEKIQALCFIADVHVVDGDTLRIGPTRYRIENIDAPETAQAKCRTEKELGEKAKRRLAELVVGSVTIVPTGRDRYGRTLARIVVGGEDVGGTLISERLARRWEGRRRGWC